MIWYAKLNGNRIGRIDPDVEDGDIRTWNPPFIGPRRLQVNQDILTGALPTKYDSEEEDSPRQSVESAPHSNCDFKSSWRLIKRRNQGTYEDGKPICPYRLAHT
jgi:hypothetical protein